MSDTRALTYILELIDNATQPLLEVSGLASKLNNTVSNVSVNANVSGASKSLYNLAGLGEEVGNKLSKAGEQASQAGAKIKEVWDPATQSIITLKVEVEKTTTQLDRLKNSLNGVTSAVGQYKAQLIGIQVATGGILTMTVKAAAEEERLAGAVTAVFGDSSEKVLEWAEAAKNITGATAKERMEMALLFKEMGQGADKSMKSAETVEKFWRNTALRQRAQAAGITSKEQLAQEIRMAEVGGRTYGLRRIFGKEAMENISEYGGAEKVLSLMNKEIEKTGKTGMDTQKAMGDFHEVVGELADEIGKTLLPTVTALFQTLTKIVIVLKDIPGVPQIIALGAAFAFLTAGAILTFGTIAHGILSIIGLLEAVKKLSIMTKIHTAMTYAWAAAQAVANGITRVLTASIGFLGNAFKALKAVMMANPWIAAFTILLAVVIALEAKFHIFEKIFEKLSKIDWAGKLAGGLEYVSKLWGGLTGKIKSIGSMAKPIMAVTMPGITIMAGLLKSIFSLAKPFIEAATPAINYLKDIYNIIKEKFEAAIKYIKDIVPDWLKSIFEAIGNFVTWMIEKIGILLSILGIKEKTPKEIAEEAETAGMTPEERLAYNQTRYAIEQASGGERGLPAVGAGNLAGWVPAFGGKYEATTFKSSRYPGEERLGKDLTEAQLMTGEWTPTVGEDEFKAFIENQKKMQEESQKKEDESQKEYTSIFDEILNWTKKIYDGIIGIVSGITEWFSENVLGTILGIAKKLGISAGPKPSQEAITAGFKSNMQQAAKEKGLSPLTEEQLDTLQKAAEGKLTYSLPPELEPYIGLSGEALKRAKEEATAAIGAEATAPQISEGGTAGEENIGEEAEANKKAIQSKAPQEVIVTNFRENIRRAAQEKGLSSLTEEQLDTLQKAAEGKLTYTLPEELEPYIGLSGPALKKAKEEATTTAGAGGAKASVSPETDKVAQVRKLVNEGKTDEAAKYLGLDPNANYTNENGLVESGREKAIRYSEWGEEALKGVTGPGISSSTSETKAPPSSESKPQSSSPKKSEKKGTGRITQSVKERASEVGGKVEKSVQSTGVKVGKKYAAATSHVGTGVEGGFKEGGVIGETGKTIVHKGEEVISEKDKTAVESKTIPSILQGINNIAYKLNDQLPQSTLSAIKEISQSEIYGYESQYQENTKVTKNGSIPSILDGIDSLVDKMNGQTLQPLPSKQEQIVNLNFYSPVVKVDKISSEMDLYRIKNDLVSFLRKEVKSAMKGGM